MSSLARSVAAVATLPHYMLRPHYMCNAPLALLSAVRRPPSAVGALGRSEAPHDARGVWPWLIAWRRAFPRPEEAPAWPRRRLRPCVSAAIRALVIAAVCASARRQAGEGVQRDPLVAHALLAKASELGDPGAQAELGFRYALGVRPAADRADALFSLGAQDVPAALLHYYFAATGNDSFAQVRARRRTLRSADGRGPEHMATPASLTAQRARHAGIHARTVSESLWKTLRRVRQS
jgi:hypothetical protein